MRETWSGPRQPEVPPSEEELHQLVAAAQSREATAFTSLYEVYFDRVYRYVALRVDSPADAEDLTEDVFLRMLEAIGSFRWRSNPSGFTAWLLRIAHNRVVDYWRRSRTRSGLPLEEAPPLFSEEDPLADMERAFAARDLGNALARLTELQRQVLALRFGGGLSVAQTASVMKRNEGAVKALQHSAVAALRRIMVPQSG